MIQSWFAIGALFFDAAFEIDAWKRRQQTWETDIAARSQQHALDTEQTLQNLRLALEEEQFKRKSDTAEV